MNESRICRRRLIRWEDICSRLRFVSWLPLRQSTNVSQSIVSSRSPERLERSRNLVWQRFILGQSVGDTPFVVIMAVLIIRPEGLLSGRSVLRKV